MSFFLSFFQLVFPSFLILPCVFIIFSFFFFGHSKRRKRNGRKVPVVKLTVFLCENSTFGPQLTGQLGMARLRVNPPCIFLLFPFSFFHHVYLWMFPPKSVLHGDVCPDDIGRDSWVWVGPLTGETLLAEENGTFPECVVVWLCSCVVVWLCGCVVVWFVWLCGCEVVWLCGCVVVWLCGCVVVWLCGCVVVWLCGCVVVWLCGCVVVGCGLWVVGCGLWVVGCGLWVVCCGLWVVGCVVCGVWCSLLLFPLTRVVR